MGVLQNQHMAADISPHVRVLCCVLIYVCFVHCCLSMLLTLGLLLQQLLVTLHFLIKNVENVIVIKQIVEIDSKRVSVYVVSMQVDHLEYFLPVSNRLAAAAAAAAERRRRRRRPQDYISSRAAALHRRDKFKSLLCSADCMRICC